MRLVSTSSLQLLAHSGCEEPYMQSSECCRFYPEPSTLQGEGAGEGKEHRRAPCRLRCGLCGCPAAQLQWCGPGLETFMLMPWEYEVRQTGKHDACTARPGLCVMAIRLRPAFSACTVSAAQGDTSAALPAGPVPSGRLPSMAGSFSRAALLASLGNPVPAPEARCSPHPRPLKLGTSNPELRAMASWLM